jgi:hypothetical protein
MLRVVGDDDKELLPAPTSAGRGKLRCPTDDVEIRADLHIGEGPDETTALLEARSACEELTLPQAAERSVHSASRAEELRQLARSLLDQ